MDALLKFRSSAIIPISIRIVAQLLFAKLECPTGFSGWTEQVALSQAKIVYCADSFHHKIRQQQQQL